MHLRDRFVCLKRISAAIATLLLESAIEKCDFTKHVRECDRNHTNRISRLKVDKLGNIEVTNVKAAKRTFGYCVGITNCERSLGSEQCVEAEGGQLRRH